MIEKLWAGICLTAAIAGVTLGMTVGCSKRPEQVAMPAHDEPQLVNVVLPSEVIKPLNVSTIATTDDKAFLCDIYLADANPTGKFPEVNYCKNNDEAVAAIDIIKAHGGSEITGLIWFSLPAGDLYAIVTYR